MPGWIGVDLDGTLAHYESWIDETHVGAPVPAMVERVKKWLECGFEVRIFTARVNGFKNHREVLELSRKPYHDNEAESCVAAIGKWCAKHIGSVMGVTNRKDYAMIELWDDRAVAVTPNTGEPCLNRGIDT